MKGRIYCSDYKADMAYKYYFSVQYFNFLEMEIIAIMAVICTNHFKALNQMFDILSFSQGIKILITVFPVRRF